MPALALDVHRGCTGLRHWLSLGIRSSSSSSGGGKAVQLLAEILRRKLMRTLRQRFVEQLALLNLLSGTSRAWHTRHLFRASVGSWQHRICVVLRAPYSAEQQSANRRMASPGGHHEWLATRPSAVHGVSTILDENLAYLCKQDVW